MYTLGGVLLLGGLSLYSGRFCAAGAFAHAQYEFTFHTPDGAPLRGVRLQVVDDKGEDSFHYPVSDYSAGSAPTSDAQGVLTFHHVNREHPEWFGSGSYLFFLIPVGEGAHAPVYYCRFVHEGREVYKARYNDLDAEATAGGETVRRRWEAPRDSESHVTAREDEQEFPLVRKAVVVRGS